MTLLYQPTTVETSVEEDYIDAFDFVTESLDEEQEEDNDAYYYGGYGGAFDTYSTFDENDYEYQQALYY